VHDLTSLKKHIFFELLGLAGRVFILVKYSEDVLIGERGFLPEEKEKGIMLVFNPAMNFAWDDQGISATLGFGTKTEKCFIPPDSIISIFSPDLNTQFSSSPPAPETAQKKPARKTDHAPSKAKEKVIKVNFSKKN
jgi:hypothetical protein